MRRGRAPSQHGSVGSKQSCACFGYAESQPMQNKVMLPPLAGATPNRCKRERIRRICRHRSTRCCCSIQSDSSRDLETADTFTVTAHLMTAVTSESRTAHSMTHTAGVAEIGAGSDIVHIRHPPSFHRQATKRV